MYYKIIACRNYSKESFCTDAIGLEILSDEFNIKLRVQDFVANYSDSYELYDDYYTIDIDLIVKSLKLYIDTHIVGKYGKLYKLSEKSLYKIVKNIYDDGWDKDRMCFTKGWVKTKYDMRNYSLRYNFHYMINKVKRNIYYY